MRRAIELIPLPATSDEAAQATVTLSFEDRHRRRIRLTDDAGEPFMLDLPRATRMRQGDRLRLEAGGSIEVRAAVEPVLEVSSSSVEDTARIAWHIGNRHTPVQVLPNGRLRLRHDHVLKDMLLGLGARVDEGEAPFAPGIPAPTVRGTAMLTDGALLRLMTWLSPSFPVGAYTYSHGLEYAVEEGLITDGDSLRTWVEGVIAFGTGRVDAALFRRAWEAADLNELDAVNEIADSLRGSSELALESGAQGNAFLRGVRGVWPHPTLDAWAARLAETQRPAAYAVAVGVVARVQEIPLRDALTAFLHAFAANLVSAGVRLVPLGQTAGQRALAALEPTIIEAAEAAFIADPADLGAAAPMVDWTSIRHETQYTRLFRS